MTIDCITDPQHDTPADLKPVRRALLSVTDKTGLVDFARALAEYGVELVSTGGTAKALRDAGLDVRDISDLTGFPEMLDGRVKTLHPKVHGGILHIRGNQQHVDAVTEHEIQPIDMVVVNLYAFEKTAQKAGVTAAEMIENIDIGGPSMVRSAAKNFEDVAVVTSVADYAMLTGELAANAGHLSRATRWRLAKQAFATTAAYDAAIASTLETIAPAEAMHAGEHAPAVFDEETLPKTIRIIESLSAVLRYGENPHQHAAVYSDGSGTGVAGATQLQGKELSYNNLVDLDACWELVSEFTETAVVIIKHTNPCGAATGTSVLDAYTRALEADPVSAFGGVLGINREVDGEAAAEIAKLFVEAIVAPSFTAEALERFGAKKNLRLVQIRPGQSTRVLKQISGGLLVQSADSHHTTEAELNVVSARVPYAAGDAGAVVRVGGVQAREVERNCVCAALRRAGTDGRHRRRADVAGGRGSLWRDEGGAAAKRISSSVRCLLSISGRSPGGGSRGGDGGDSAWRLDAGLRGD